MKPDEPCRCEECRPGPGIDWEARHRAEALVRMLIHGSRQERKAIQTEEKRKR